MGLLTGDGAFDQVLADHLGRQTVTGTGGKDDDVAARDSRSFFTSGTRRYLLLSLSQDVGSERGLGLLNRHGSSPVPRA